MDSALFWWIVVPMLVAAAITYLAIAAVGLGVIVAAYRSLNPMLSAALMAAGVLVIASPALYHMGMEWHAQSQADVRQVDLERLERTELAGRLPRRFIAVGDFTPELISAVEIRHDLRRFSEAENKRLVDAYRAYRKAERCHRLFGGETVPGTKLPKCKPLPASIQTALALREPVLVFASGRDTSLRQDNIMAGEIYEIRLITPQDDRLVDYFEERTVKGTPSIFNPYAPPRRLDDDAPAPTLEAFIDSALQNASR